MSDERDSDRGSGDYPGLSLLARNKKGSDGSASVRDRHEAEAACPPGNDDAGPSTKRRGRPSRKHADAPDSGGLRTDHDGNGPGNKRLQADSIQSLGAIIDSQLPDVPNGHRAEAAYTATSNPETWFREGDEVLDDKYYYHVTSLIRRNKIQILEAPMDMEHKNFAAVLRAKSALVMSHETMQVRVGEAAVAVKMKQREDWSEVFAAVDRAKAERQRLIDSNVIDASVLDII